MLAYANNLLQSAINCYNAKYKAYHLLQTEPRYVRLLLYRYRFSLLFHCSFIASLITFITFITFHRLFHLLLTNEHSVLHANPRSYPVPRLNTFFRAFLLAKGRA